MNKVISGYLDHNILDSILKGDPFKIVTLLHACDITPVFSYENLIEIKRSIGSEADFLSLLDQMNAKYIEPCYENNLITDNAQIHDCDIGALWNWFVKNHDAMPEYGYGLGGMLEKFYGGRSDESYSDIFTRGTEELNNLLNEALSDIDPNGILTTDMKVALRELPIFLNAQHQQISTELDNQNQSEVKDFEKATSVGPKILKNIKPPNVIQQVFDAIQKSIPDVALDIDQFFGVTSQEFEPNPDRQKSMPEKVNAIYHQLNFLGYYRDTDMKKKRGFIRSTSDMTHAGAASYCNLLLSCDEGLVKKAEAAYEYLNAKTRILHFRNVKKKQIHSKSEGRSSSLMC